MKLNSLWLILICVVVLLVSCQEEPNQGENKPLHSSTGVMEIDKLSELIAEDSTNAKWFRKRGDLYYEREIYNEAIRDYNKAVILDSLHPPHFHVLADAYLDNNMSFEALEVMKDAAKRFPSRIETKLKLSEYQLILKQYLEALTTVNGLIEKHPLEAEAHFMKGRIYRDMGAHAKAMESFQRTVELDPDLGEAYFYMGNMMAEENPELALRFYDNAILADGENVIFQHAKALHFHQNSMLEEAKKVYQKCHLMDPQYAEAFYNAGLLYLEQDSLMKAKQMFQIATETEPAFAKAHYYLGFVQQTMGDEPNAIHSYKKALQLNPSIEEAQEAIEQLTAQ